MILLVAGLVLWVGAHFFQRAAPERRAAMQAEMGDASKGLIAGVLALSILAMIFGYRWAPYIQVWSPPVWTVHVNNLLMIFAIALFGLGSSKSRFRGSLRHPMLLGFALWSVAHLLVNGNLAAIVLWGVFLIWAVAEIVVINAREPGWEPYEGGSLAGDVRLGIITLVLYAVITAIHAWLNVWPFPG